ncbi:hypothetical protein IEC97_19700 [Neobacillus cucumis]|uniref:hypothetical protein n=1 Tax=Neobacillus cucumis TaxID=1740721 RepID=UPI0018DF806C|nr:hypothetical protein [Neobacillus cucumis]MBI0579590.1 hypothetical protein [Neobacillus cucumis]
MNKLTKGALTMVLVGSVTFSVTNALFGDTIKQITQGNDVTESENQKITDQMDNLEKTGKNQPQKSANNVNQAEKTVAEGNLVNKAVTVAIQETPKEKNVEAQTAKTTVKDVKITASHPSTAPKTVVTNEKKSDKVVVPIQKNTTTTRTASTTIHSTAPATHTTTSSQNSTTTGSTGNRTSSTKSVANTAPKSSTTTTTTSNHGQQVSQAAIEKAAIRQDTKENNGKNK